MRIEQGGAGDAGRLLALFDDAVAWLVARGQTGQWGTEPFSARPGQAERAQDWAEGGGLWFAVDGTADAGAIVVGDAHDTRNGSFDVDGWPGAILVREL